jgi:hypothetical protein
MIMTRRLAAISRNALKPGWFGVMARKLLARAFERDHVSGSPEARAWATAHEQDAAAIARSLDAGLWAEAEAAWQAFRPEAEQKLAALDIDLGGGGHYPLLYFLVRHLRPQTVLETGVASDFPYFRFDKPEHFVGYLIDDSLRADWSLYIQGDDRNLTHILPQVTRIDMLHYDSDKSYSGRKRVLDAVAPKLASGAVIVMDDIGDNMFFHDYVTEWDCPFRVFGWEGKHVGLIGL